MAFVLVCGCPKGASAQGRGSGQLNEFVYFTDSAGNLNVYAVSSTTGALTPMAGSPYTAGTTPVRLTTSPNGLYVYVANQGSNNVSGFTSAAGALAPAPGSPYPAGIQPNAVVLNSIRSRVFVANCGSSCFGTGNGSISMYVQNLYGTLTQAPGSPFPAGSSTIELVVDSSNQFLYATNSGSANVSGYSIGNASLTAIPGSPFPVGLAPLGIAASPVAELLYVVNANSENVSAFTINAGTGVLTPVAGSPFPTTAPPNVIAIDATGQFAYVMALDGVEAYSISASGALTPLPSSPVSIGTGSIAVGISIDRYNHFLYVAGIDSSFDGWIWGFSINSKTGALTAVPGSPYALPAMPEGIAASPAQP